MSSFFEGVYMTMPREERRRIFAATFRWHHRRSFVLFLAAQGYLHGRIEPTDFQTCMDIVDSRVSPCDILFDVEDLYRYICKFL